MEISALDHIVLNVGNVERSLQFYQQVLGLSADRVEAWRKREIGFPSLRINASTLIDLVEVPTADANTQPNLAHFCLVTDSANLDQAIHTLASAGIEVETGPAVRWGAKGNAMSIYFRDPDHNLIELRTYRSSNGG
jgi:catechol 2,3-dioxygenase-like lactoylglutathione lyase family enzyme